VSIQDELRQTSRADCHAAADRIDTLETALRALLNAYHHGSDADYNEAHEAAAKLIGLTDMGSS
jgi:hypothetical protein